MVELVQLVFILQDSTKDPLVIAKQHKGHQEAYRQTDLDGLALTKERAHSRYGWYEVARAER